MPKTVKFMIEYRIYSNLRSVIWQRLSYQHLCVRFFVGGQQLVAGDLNLKDNQKLIIEQDVNYDNVVIENSFLNNSIG